MRQLDVFVNPIRRTRSVFPLLTLLQSDAARLGVDRIVAPLAPGSTVPAAAKKLLPLVRVEDRDYLLMMPGLTSMSAALLGKPVASLDF